VLHNAYVILHIIEFACLTNIVHSAYEEFCPKNRPPNSEKLCFYVLSMSVVGQVLFVLFW